MNRLLTAAVLLFFFQTGFACINEYYTHLDGTVFSSEGAGRIVRHKIDKAKARETADKLLDMYRNPVMANTPLDNRMEVYSDYGVQLIYLGEYEKAKQVYREIERLSPHRYQTASNLGTVYELLGQNDSALVWIRKAVALNPDSHEGSEWIHIKILKWKLRGGTTPTAGMLGLSFGREELPSNPYNVDLDELSTHLHRQLSERTKLVPPENLIVGRMYFDLGNIIAQTHSAEHALAYYEAAQDYGYRTLLVETRIAAMKDLADNFSSERWVQENRDWLREYFVVIVVGGLLLFAAGVWIAWRIVRNIRRRRRAKQAA